MDLVGKKKKGWIKEMKLLVSAGQPNGTGVCCVTAQSLLHPETVPGPEGKQDLLQRL